jgi:peptide deformylase
VTTASPVVLSWEPDSLVEAGTVRPPVLAPAPGLSRPGAAIDPTSPAALALAADLIATMHAAPACVGLAASQIGVDADMFAVDVTDHPKTRICHGLFVLCNTEILAASRWQRAREGCLSVPDLTGDVKRAGSVMVRGYLPGRADPVTLATDSFEARALQHEIDHCAGRLFLDRVAGPHAIFARKVYQ